MTDSDKQAIVAEHGVLEKVSQSITHDFGNGEQRVEDISTYNLRVKLPKGVSSMEFGIGEFYQGNPFTARGTFQVLNRGNGWVLLVMVE